LIKELKGNQNQIEKILDAFVQENKAHICFLELLLETGNPILCLRFSIKQLFQDDEDLFF
jgi:hypothetical protein